MKIKLTLDEKYKYLVGLVRQSGQPLSQFDLLRRNLEDDLVELSQLWFGYQSYENAYKVVERIHSADEIEYNEPEYNWRLKSDKFDDYCYLSLVDNGLRFEDYIECSAKFSESELKKLLEGTGLPFEAFERVEADED